MRRILLIEDDSGVRELWERFHGVMEPTFRGQCEMDLAIDLEQGKARIAGTKYDAIILDLTLPPLGKDEVLSWLFENTHELPPVIVLTGSEEVNIRMRSINAGAAQFFTKADAIQFPNLFFKILYNEYLKRIYAAPRTSTV